MFIDIGYEGRPRSSGAQCFGAIEREAGGTFRSLYVVSHNYYVFNLPWVAPKATEEEQPVRS
jgi:hypothetical protein